MHARYKEALEHFERIAQAQKRSWLDVHWHGQIDNCDVCSRPMSDERFMIDGPSSPLPEPPWGNLCVVCAQKYSPAIGWGEAQLYERQKNRNWILVAGGPPSQSTHCPPD